MELASKLSSRSVSEFRVGDDLRAMTVCMQLILALNNAYISRRFRIISSRGIWKLPIIIAGLPSGHTTQILISTLYNICSINRPSPAIADKPCVACKPAISPAVQTFSAVQSIHYRSLCYRKGVVLRLIVLLCIFYPF